MPGPVISAGRKIWRDGSLDQGSFGEGARLIPEETALALTYNGGTYAVMMGTPQNLRDFAIGFSLSEGIVQSADEIDSVDIVELDEGIEGLIHVSEFDDSAHAGKEGKIELVVGETYPMKIIKLAPAERKIGLSIRALKSDEFRADWESYQESAGDGSATLGDHFRNR